MAVEYLLVKLIFKMFVVGLQCIIEDLIVNLQLSFTKSKSTKPTPESKLINQCKSENEEESLSNWIMIGRLTMLDGMHVPMYSLSQANSYSRISSASFVFLSNGYVGLEPDLLS